MDFTNFFFGNTKKPTPDVIGNSLRFRNNGTATNYLTNADLNFLGDQTYTLSYWLKKGCSDDWSGMNVDVFNNDTSAGGTPGAGVHHAAGGGLSMYSGSGFARGYPGSPNFRDLNGWYHFCHARNATGWQTWVNGINLGIVEISDLDGAGGTKIMNPWGGGQAQASATLAEYYCIDGQYLTADNFGMFDDNNVWVPVEVDFGIGVKKFSDNCAGYTGVFNPNSNEQNYEELGPKGLFNGLITGDGCRVPGSGYINANFDPPLKDVTSLKLFAGYWNEILVNGTLVEEYAGNNAPYQYVDLSAYIPANGEITQVAYGSLPASGTSARARAIEVNGSILADPYIWSTDLTSSTGAFSASQTPNLAFDGNTATEARCSAGGVGNYLEFAPSIDIPFKTLEVYSPSPNVVYSYDDHGVTVPSVGDTFVLVAENGTLSSTQTVRSTSNNSSTAPNICAIRINGQILVDGVNSSFGPNGWYLKFDDPSNPGKDSSGNGNDFTATNIDGDSSQISYDFLTDAPQSNTSVFAPNYAYGAQAEFTDANLTTRGAAGVEYSYSSYVLQPEDTGKYYCEFTTTSVVSSDYPTIFFCQDTGGEFGTAPNTYFYLAADGELVTTMATKLSGTEPSFTNFDVVGILVDLANDTVEIKVNGVDGVVVQLDNREYVNVAIQHFTNSMVYANFGQQPFKHAPDNVSGFVSDNQPKPAIIDGSAHHQTIVGPGQGGYGLYYHLTETDYNLGIENMTFLGVIPGNSVNAQQFVCDCFDLVDTTSFTISNGWGWLGGNAQVYVSVDGSENSWIQTSNDQTMGNNETVTVSHSSPFRYFKLNYKIVGQVNFGDITTANSPLLERARNLFPNGFYWIKDRVNGSTQHQLLDTINGDSAWRLPNPTAAQTYVPPAGDSAAWCWSAPDSWTDASIDTGYRNVKAGFSMFTYTGDGANTRDIAHGLGKAPDCVIIFNPESNDVNTYIRGLEGTGSSTKNLVFSTTEQAGNIFGAGIIYAPDSPSTITVGLSQDPASVNGVNKDGVTYRCYCWTTVPGYSQFGTYVGNGQSPKGTYTHMNFQPSFMITKPTGEGDWRIYDTTRSPWNPVNSCLKNATTQAEETGGQEMDWISTGVRNRDNGSPNNGASTEYAYMAFAKHPTKYSNAR